MPAHMVPEQMTGDPNFVDAQIEISNLGVIHYELLR